MVFHDIPDDEWFNALILVTKQVSNTGDLRPWDLRLERPHLRWN